MSKYRLSYLKKGILTSIDLSKLDCLNGMDTADINIIDKFTSNFNNNDDLVSFLINNNIMMECYRNSKLQITIDKKAKETLTSYNKPIFNSDKLIFKGNKNKLSASYGANKIRSNMNNIEYIQMLVSNYKGKYQKSKNENGDSAILGNLDYIDREVVKISKTNYTTINENIEYISCIDDLIEKEFFKTNTKGIRTTNYRGLHDFIVIDNEIDNLLKNQEEKEESNLNDNIYIEEEEFLTTDDFDRINSQIFGIKKPHQINRLSNKNRALFSNLQEDSKKYIKKLDGDC